MDAKRNYQDCESTDANIVRVAQSLSADAYLRFTADSAGRCTEIRVAVDSATTAKRH